MKRVKDSSRATSLRSSTMVIFFGLGALLVGCVTVPPEAPEEEVRPRVEAWLGSVLASDMESAYEFTSPAYRSAHGMRHYAKAYAGRDMWRQVEISDIKCNVTAEYGQCGVVLLVTYRGFLMEHEMTTQLPQTWVRVDGVWYTTPIQ